MKLATHLQTKRSVAVKCVKKRDMKPIEMLQLRREVEALRLCGAHANVMPLLDFFENEEAYYLVTDHIRGGDLFDYLKARNFSLAEGKVREIIQQLL